mmetsp:Transcript_39733/g.83532  ORF Transcript_39733/g.83532 Transcript_39733/m.83532 type:complete len:110 (-) Transcript_39733:933-1262(-)
MPHVQSGLETAMRGMPGMEGHWKRQQQHQQQVILLRKGQIECFLDDDGREQQQQRQTSSARGRKLGMSNVSSRQLPRRGAMRGMPCAATELAAVYATPSAIAGGYRRGG